MNPIEKTRAIENSSLDAHQSDEYLFIQPAPTPMLKVGTNKRYQGPYKYVSTNVNNENLTKMLQTTNITAGRGQKKRVYVDR